MPIYWNPVEDDIHPETIEVYDGDTKIGTADVSGVPGMPDRIGGIAPDAVREIVANERGLSTFEAAYDVEYVRGTPE